MEPSPSLNPQFRKIAIFFIMIIAIFSTIVLLNWIMHWNTIITEGKFETKSMCVFAAISFLLLSSGLVLYTFQPGTSRFIFLAKIAASLVLLVNIIFLFDAITDSNIGGRLFDHLFPDGGVKNKISPFIITNLLLSSISLLLILPEKVKNNYKRSVAAWLAMISIFYGFVIIIAYLYSLSTIYSHDYLFMGVMLPTAISVFLLGLTFILILGEEYLPLRAFLGDSIFSTLMRRFIPLTIFLIFFQGWLNIIILPHSKQASIIAFIISFILVIFLVMIIAKCTQSINKKMDAANLERKRLEGELSDTRKNYESRMGQYIEDLEHSNRELQEFVHIASHDLQEPLRMISSFLQLLERRYKDQLDDEAHEFINFAVGGANRLQAMINDLLIYSHLGKRTAVFELVDCNAILQEALDNLQIEIANNKAEIISDILPTIKAEKFQLLQVFQNLLSNAIKFHKPDVVPLIHVSIADQTTEWLFCIKDNGFGIDPQFADKLFVIFKRLVGREYPGAGIGLIICKKIVESHHGKIWVESKLGVGSSFYFTLPKIA